MPTVDQRNLSLTNYDYTLDVYRQRARELAANSQGLERFLYRIFGPRLMGSIACAMDPWAKFRFPKVKISPTNRTRKVLGVQAEPRSYSTFWQDATSHKGNQPGSSWDYTDTSSSPPPHDYADEAQSAIYGFISDTTRRTRDVGTEFGEFELFIPNFNSSGSGYQYTRSTYVWVDTFSLNDYFYCTDGTTTYVVQRRGPSYLLKTSGVSVTNPRSRGATALSKRGLQLVVQSLPTARRYRSIYQLGELKDLPQLLFGTIKAWRDFEAIVGRKKFIELLRSPVAWDGSTKALLKDWASSLRISTLDKDLSNAYLCFKFGWQSTVSAIDDLVRKPAKISKEINSLILRNGLATSFRSKISWIEKEDSPPATYLRGFASETLISSSNTGIRKCTMRCMVNASFEFPTLETPRLRSQLWIRKLGLDPRPSDIYDLIPWTWLIDWFSGIGDYIHTMDAIYQDQSLVNFGFLTYREDVECVSSAEMSYQSRSSRTINGVEDVRTQKEFYSVSGIYSHKYIVRKSLASVAGIKTQSSSSLTNDQKAILGALFGAKNNTAMQIARR